MASTITWVHGIGDHKPGYSEPWKVAFNEYLELHDEDYLEVCWEMVFDQMRALPRDRAAARGSLPVALSQQEQLAEVAARGEITAILLARAAAQGKIPVQPQRAARGRARGPVAVAVWPPPRSRARAGSVGARGLIPDWLLNPDEYLGDFAKYLVSRSVRTAVKERAKAILRPLADDPRQCNVIAHSWGTVVAYDCLLDLEAELPALRVANFITLGSPLWAVSHFLEDHSGRKPGNLAAWINIHARDDLVGSRLHPSFRVDTEYEVENFGGDGAHGSYFVPHNVVVQRDIVAAAILGPGTT